MRLLRTFLLYSQQINKLLDRSILFLLIMSDIYARSDSLRSKAKVENIFYDIIISDDNLISLILKTKKPLLSHL